MPGIFFARAARQRLLTEIADWTCYFAQDSTRYVATTGADSGNCTNPSNPCRTVQCAVDAAGHQDLIKVATGIYTGVQGRPAPRVRRSVDRKAKEARSA